MLVTLIGSGAFALVLFVLYWLFDSQLALALAADSTMDVFTSAVLAWTVAIAAQPDDDNHPFGHHRAEPVGALVVAVLAGVLALEVAHSAVDKLLGEPGLETTNWLVAAFAGKALFKAAVFLVAGRLLKRAASPAVAALRIDARNDVFVSCLAVVGFVAVQAGMPELDAWLALPVAGWILWAGIDLARENIRLLMGEAPSLERQNELRELAASMPGVLSVHDLKAHYLGTRLQVKVHVVVDPDIPLKEAHDIGEGVRQCLEAEEDVSQALIHIDIE